MKPPLPIKKNRFPGYIYLIRMDNIRDTIYKIGRPRDIMVRLSSLCCETGRNTTLIAYGYSEDVILSETALHNKLFKYCIHGEYYKFNNGQLINVIKEFRKNSIDVETDYTEPECPRDNCKLIIVTPEQQFKCPSCDFIVYFDRYMEEPERMLPYSYNELNDDEGWFHNTRYNHIHGH